jgi:hypothetical protein
MPRTPRGYSPQRAVLPGSLFERDDDGTFAVGALRHALPPAEQTAGVRREQQEDLERALFRRYRAKWEANRRQRHVEHDGVVQELSRLVAGPHAGSVALPAGDGVEMQIDDIGDDDDFNPFGSAALSRLPGAVTIGTVDASACRMSTAEPFEDTCSFTFCLPITKNRHTLDQEPRFIPHADESVETSKMTEYLNAFRYPPTWERLEDPDGTHVQSLCRRAH